MKNAFDLSFLFQSLPCYLFHPLQAWCAMSLFLRLPKMQKLRRNKIINFMHVSSSALFMLCDICFVSFCTVFSISIFKIETQKTHRLHFFANCRLLLSPNKWQSTDSHFNLSLTWVDKDPTKSSVRHTQDLFKMQTVFKWAWCEMALQSSWKSQLKISSRAVNWINSSVFSVRCLCGSFCMSFFHK